MKKVLLFAALIMSGVMLMNNAFAGWSCIAMNKANPPSQFSGIAPQGMSGPNAKANAQAAALQACQSSPLTAHAGNCLIVSCTLS